MIIFKSVLIGRVFLLIGLSVASTIGLILQYISFREISNGCKVLREQKVALQNQFDYISQNKSTWIKWAPPKLVEKYCILWIFSFDSDIKIRCLRTIQIDDDFIEKHFDLQIDDEKKLEEMIQNSPFGSIQVLKRFKRDNKNHVHISWKYSACIKYNDCLNIYDFSNTFTLEVECVAKVGDTWQVCINGIWFQQNSSLPWKNLFILECEDSAVQLLWKTPHGNRMFTLKVGESREFCYLKV